MFIKPKKHFSPMIIGNLIVDWSHITPQFASHHGKVYAIVSVIERDDYPRAQKYLSNGHPNGHRITNMPKFRRKLNVLHAQLIPLGTYNFIRKLNHKRPISKRKALRSLHHPLNTLKDGLVFNAHLFHNPYLPKVRGRRPLSINIASITPSTRKFNLHRQIVNQAHDKSLYLQQIKHNVLKHSHHPYDAFNYATPRELRDIFGDTLQSYKFSSDYREAHDPNSRFFKDRPIDLDHKDPKWNLARAKRLHHKQPKRIDKIQRDQSAGPEI